MDEPGLVDGPIEGRWIEGAFPDGRLEGLDSDGREEGLGVLGREIFGEGREALTRPIDGRGPPPLRPLPPRLAARDSESELIAQTKTSVKPAMMCRMR